MVLWSPRIEQGQERAETGLSRASKLRFRVERHRTAYGSCEGETNKPIRQVASSIDLCCLLLCTKARFAVTCILTINRPDPVVLDARAGKSSLSLRRSTMPRPNVCSAT